MNEFDVNRRERLLPSTNLERPNIGGIRHKKEFPAGNSVPKTFANDKFGPNTTHCVIEHDSGAETSDIFVHFTMDGTDPKPGSGMSGYPPRS